MRDWKGWADMKWLNLSVHMLNLDLRCRDPILIFTSLDSKVRVQCWLFRINSNLNLILPFNILMMKDWKGWDAVNCLNQPEDTQSGCEKWVWTKPNLYPLITWKWVVVTILEPVYQSQLYLTIHYTYNERLEGLSWYEMAESVCSYAQSWFEV